jgi:hypothetical protein
MFRYSIIFYLTFILSGCGDEFDLNQLPVNEPPVSFGDTSYIEQFPPISSLNKPTDIMVGNEPLIYIADAGNNRIVQLDISGGFISYSEFILNPKKLAQDRNYDLLVIASIIDTIPPNILDTVDVIYRFKLLQNGGILTGLVPTIAFRSDQPTPIPGDHGNFTAITTFYDNYYLVSRSGRNNSSQIDPDNAVFRINRFDDTEPVPERLPGFEVEGQGLMSLRNLSGLAAFSFNNTDFIYTQVSNEAAFKVQWVVYDFVNGTYTSKFTPEDGTDLLRNNLVIEPRDVTTDQFSNIYIVDSFKDSLFKFNSLGKIKSETFGGFNNPWGVAFFNKTLYIADKDNNLIRRFILSTDIN